MTLRSPPSSNTARGAALDKLISFGSPAICTEAPDRIETYGADERLVDELSAVLAKRNGFLAFEGALHVLPATTTGGELTLAAWNSDALWRKYYGELVKDCLFFAQDAFGFQFAIKNNEIHHFDPESCGFTFLADDFEEWARQILTDFEVLTGYGLAHEWQLRNRGLTVTERLFPRRPFVLGGSFDLENLVAAEAMYGMQFRGFLAQQLKDLPDGTQVQIEFEIAH